MESFQNIDGLVIIENLIKTIHNNKNFLSEVDGAIGDGDHGVNMDKGFTLCGERLNSDMDMTTGLDTLGNVLLMEIGGSMGPLYGSFFIEMSMASKNKTEIGKKDFAEILEGGLKGIQAFDKAKVGDKTLLDTLVPAIEAYNEAIGKGKSFISALEDMKDAAEKGKESTKNMLAKIGRASRLGERSRGVLDAGATSCNLILQTIADTIILLIK